MSKDFDCLVYIGRFQPFHNGHLEIVQRALARAQTVVVVLGSAKRARNIKNPFSDSEREQMIAAAIGELGAQYAGRLVFCSVRDYYDNDKWVAAVKQAVHNAARPQARIGIIGHQKDASSYYLHEFAEWRLVHEENHGGLSATDVRRALFVQGDVKLDHLASRLPPSVLAFLKAFQHAPEFVDLVEEFRAIEQYKASWASAPYPPIFVTVDAVVRCRDQVLLVQRGGQPGRGQWALPGGFLDQHERLQQAALRELAEETGLAIPPEALRLSLAGTAVFDHPDRSVRGRTITHAFYFDLNGLEPPAVAGADDAAEARWVHVGALREMETMMFEDHLHILDRFLKLW